MLRLLSFLIVLGIAALGLHWLSASPGDITLNWQGYRVETSLVVLVGFLILVMVLLGVLWSLLRTVLDLPHLWSVFFQRRHERRGNVALSKGLIAIGSGDVTTAQRAMKEAVRFLGTTPLTLLLQAQTAQIMGDRSQAERLFHDMVNVPETHLLGLRGLYVEAQRRGALSEALGYASKAAQDAPSIGWASEASLYHACLEQRWREALTWLERRHKQKLVSNTDFKKGRAALLTAEALYLAPQAPDSALTLVEDAVSTNPDLIPAIVLNGKLLSERRSWRKAMRLLEAGWKRTPHPAIAECYVHLRFDDTVQDRLDRAHQLLKLTPEHVEAHLAFAHAALKSRHFALAHTSLSWLLTHYPTARVYDLAMSLDEAETGHIAKIREWSHKKRYAPPDPCWMADGQTFPEWLPFSPLSGRLNALIWTTPPASNLITDHGAMLLSPEDARRDVMADIDERIVPLPPPPDAPLSRKSAIDIDAE